MFYRLENDHVRQLVTDAVFNAEHAAGGIPAHHRELQQGCLMGHDHDHDHGHHDHAGGSTMH